MGTEVIVFTTSSSKVEHPKRLASDDVVFSKDQKPDATLCWQTSFRIACRISSTQHQCILNPLRADGSLTLVGAPEHPLSDIQNNELWNGFKHLAQEAGLQACWSTAIVSSRNKLLATFAVYYPEVREPGAKDREAVELLFRTAGIVIEWYQEISERHLVEEALRKSGTIEPLEKKGAVHHVQCDYLEAKYMTR